MDLVTQQLLERRARILQTARDLIGEVGYQGLTMRHLATRCGVSVPTLYNQFGSKDQLLAAAVQSHFASLLTSSAPESRGIGHEYLISIMQLRAREITRLPGFHRKLLGAFMSTRDTESTEAELRTGLAGELSKALAEMREQGQLADWADAELLAKHLTGACVASAVAWATGVLDDAELEATMLLTACMLTLGAASGDARDALQREAVKAQATLAEKRTEEPARQDISAPASAVEA